MKNLTCKKVILWLAAMVLLVTSCATAFASPGDRTLKHVSSLDSDINESIDCVFRIGDGFGVIGSDEAGKYILKYADTQSEPEKYVLQEFDYDPFGEMTEEMPEEMPEAAEAETEEKPAEPAAEEKPDAAEPADEGVPAVEGLLNWDDIDWSDEALDDEPEQPVITDWENFQFDYEPVYYVSYWFDWNGEIYGIAIAQNWDQETGENKVYGIKVKHFRLEDGQAIEEDTDLPEWNYEKITDEMDTFGSFYLQNVCTAGDTLLGQTWGMTGSIIVAVDLKTGECSVVKPGQDSNVIAFTAGPEGSVLLATYDWMAQKTTVIRKNLSDEKEETLLELENTVDSVGLSYAPDTDTLYMARDGELWKGPLADLTKLEAVNDCPLSDCRITELSNGFVLAWNSNNILLRNTDPAVRGTVALHVEDNTGYNQTMSETVFTLNEKRGDLSVIIRQQNSWRAQSTVLTDMMNKDAGTDIYVLPYAGTNFNALKKRGYLADLSDNAEIAESVNRMYPYIQDALKQDGKIIAVPIGLTGDTFGFNYGAWEKIGGTEEELPKTWNQFLDWLEKLPERLEGTEVNMIEDPYMGENLSGMFFSDMLYQYQMLMDGKGEEIVFNTPMLAGLLERVNNIDYRDLGMKSYEDLDGGGYTIMIDGNYILTNRTVPPMGDRYNEYGFPLALSFEENEDPIVPVQIYVACVNPYSEHAAEAKEFLALAMENLDLESQYAFFTDKTEPMRYSFYERERKNMDKWLEDAKKQAEEAEEGAERIGAEESVKNLEEEIKKMEETYWEISPKRLARFQAILPFCRVLDHDFQQEIQGSISEQDRQMLMTDDTGDKMDYGKYLSFLDQKMQMIRNEGK